MGGNVMVNQAIGAVISEGNTWSVRHGSWIVAAVGAMVFAGGLVAVIETTPGRSKNLSPSGRRWRLKVGAIATVVGLVLLVGGLLT
jgi:hypothetical protein